MIKKNYLEFGILSKNKEKKKYELLKGDLYDYYMLSRYFKDIFNLYKSFSIKKYLNKEKFHDLKDFKFNHINYLLLSLCKTKKFYEFGFTLYEKIFYFKLFNSIFNKKISIKKINFLGNDISEIFIFFSQNFYKDYNLKLSKVVKKSFYKNSIFYAKGVSLLYEKKNMEYLKNFVKFCEAGTFDISILQKKKKISLNTGYKLYYPSISDFSRLLKIKGKHFFFRNLKKKNSKIYFEVLFGRKEICSQINNNLTNIMKNKKLKNVKNFISFERFKELKLDYFN